MLRPLYKSEWLAFGGKEQASTDVTSKQTAKCTSFIPQAQASKGGSAVLYLIQTSTHSP